MALSELSYNYCLPEKHDWHLNGKIIEEGVTIGELDIELGSCRYKLSDIVNMAKRSGVDSWRLSCDRCGKTQMYGTFLPKKE